MSAALRMRLLPVILVLAVMSSPPRALTVAQRGNQVLLDGKPTPLLFARGCARPEEAPAYRAAGFNTLLVRIDSPGESAREQARALVAAAAAADLYILIELANGSWSEGERASLGDEKYRENVAYFLEEIIPRFADAPRLVGWIISTVEEGRLISDDVGKFSSFLQAKYGAIDRLNETWSYGKDSSDTLTMTFSSRIPAFAVITEENAASLASPHAEVRKIVTADIAEYRAALVARDADFQRYLRTRYTSVEQLDTAWSFQFQAWEDIRIATLLERDKQKPQSSPLSLLELARYQATAPRELMDWWARQVRERNPGRLVIAGGQYSYRTLVALPPSVNGAFTECYPGLAEADLQAHNPHAIDIARRGNRFIALAGVLARNVPASTLPQYLYSAAVHGAAGIGVLDWQLLAESGDHYAAVQRSLADLVGRGLLCREPAPRIAIVYSPYAIGPPLASRPLYGYAPNFPTPGPGLLIFSLRQGTCYGQIDYLAAEDLTAVPLERYRTLLLPSALDLPAPSQEALARFVDGGGAALADLGLATLQANGNFHFLPPQMAELFGVLNAPGLRDARLNFEVYRQNPRFARLTQGLRTTGMSAGYMIARAAKAIPVPGTDLLFQGVASREIRPPTPRPHAPLKPEAVTGMFIASRGKGFALYAPVPLYQCWTAENLLFEEFHRDLLGAGAEIELQRPVDFLPALAEVAVYADASVVLWGKGRTAPVARVRNPQRRAFSVPYGQCEVGPGANTVLRTTTSGVNLITPLPIMLEPTAHTVLFSAAQVNAQGLLFDLANSAEGGDTPVSLRVGNGDYRIAPGSRHRITIITRTEARDETAQADAEGWLRLTVPGSGARVLITSTQSLVDVQQPATPAASPPSREVIIQPTPEGSG